jgi:hypothetical protein
MYTGGMVDRTSHGCTLATLIFASQRVSGYSVSSALDASSIDLCDTGQSLRGYDSLDRTGIYVHALGLMIFPLIVSLSRLLDEDRMPQSALSARHRLPPSRVTSRNAGPGYRRYEW